MLRFGNFDSIPDEFADRESLKEEFIERISKDTLVQLKDRIQMKQAEKAA